MACISCVSVGVNIGVSIGVNVGVGVGVAVGVGVGRPWRACNRGMSCIRRVPA